MFWKIKQPLRLLPWSGGLQQEFILWDSKGGVGCPSTRVISASTMPNWAG